MFDPSSEQDGELASEAASAECTARYATRGLHEIILDSRELSTGNDEFLDYYLINTISQGVSSTLLLFLLFCKKIFITMLYLFCLKGKMGAKNVGSPHTMLTALAEQGWAPELLQERAGHA